MPTSLTPNEMRALKAQTGKPLGELLGGDENDMEQAPDRIQALVWVGLRRAGYQASWDQAGDVSPDTDRGARGPYEQRQLEGLVNFCRFWRMTPRQVDELHPDEYDAMVAAAMQGTAGRSARSPPGQKGAPLVANPQVVVDFVANTRSLQTGAAQASGAASGMGSRLKELGKTAA